ncbi:ornithine cyclodeaminase family protein [Salinifilum ghardaiensis]
MTTRLPYVDAEQITELVSSARAVDLMSDALRAGSVDPESDTPRLSAPAPNGEFLLMPTALAERAAVKVATVAPGNPAAGLPKIQGVYVLFDSATLAPVALMDAVELTLVRTPAATTLAVRQMLAAGDRDRVERLVVFGTGPQAERHARCLHEVIAPGEVVLIGRREQAARELAARCKADGIGARAGSRDDVRHAEVVVCATSSPTPLFADELVGPDTVVAAVGAHGPDHHELPPALLRRADVAVEGRASAMREGGNLLAARPAAEWERIDVANLADLATGRLTRHAGRPAVFSGVGMSWEDLVVASEVAAQLHDPLGGEHHG